MRGGQTKEKVKNKDQDRKTRWGETPETGWKERRRKKCKRNQVMTKKKGIDKKKQLMERTEGARQSTDETQREQNKKEERKCLKNMSTTDKRTCGMI